MGTDNIYARVDIHRDRFQNRYRSHITHRQTTLSPMVFRAISSCLALWNTWCVMAQAWQLPPLPLIEELIIKAGASFNALQVLGYSLEWGSRPSNTKTGSSTRWVTSAHQTTRSLYCATCSYLASHKDIDFDSEQEHTIHSGADATEWAPK